MFLLVALHVTNAGESLFAYGAAIRPFSRVDTEVDPQLGGVSEALPAMRTLERSLAGVHQVVTIELRLLPEAAATNVAFVRPEARVDVFVASQVGRVGEATPAQLTHVLLLPSDQGRQTAGDAGFLQKVSHGERVAVQLGLGALHAVQHVVQARRQAFHLHSPLKDKRLENLKPLRY